mgnify:CR=1 FL=1
MVIMSMETYEKNLFLSNVYGKLEEANRDMKSADILLLKMRI